MFSRNAIRQGGALHGQTSAGQRPEHRQREEQQTDLKVVDEAVADVGGRQRRAQQAGKVRITSLARFLWYGLRHGGLRTTPIQAVATFGDGATLDVPGTPRVILVPGFAENFAFTLGHGIAR